VADTKISALTAYSTEHGDDLLPIVDVHDTSMAASGTDKKATVNQLFGSPSSGQVLYWSGSSTGTPAGAAKWAIGSSGQITATAIADPGSPSATDLWMSSTKPNVFTILRGGLPCRIGGKIWEMTAAGTANANSTTLSSVLSSPPSIPANTLQVGDILRFGFHGTMSMTSSQPTGQANIYLGATVIGSSGAVTPSAVAISSGIWFDLYRIEFQVQAIGVSGSIIGTGCLFGNQSGGGAMQTYVISGGSTNATAPTAVTINTTGALTFDLKWQWGTASASNTCQVLSAYLYLDG
jgi:hypothetical protein